MNATNFDKYVQRYIDEGILKKIYGTETFSIYNFGGLFYLGCPHDCISGKAIFGVMLNGKSIREVVEQNILFFNLLKKLFASNQISKCSIDLSPKNFSAVKKYVAQEQERQRTENLPIFVDEALEKELMDKYM